MIAHALGVLRLLSWLASVRRPPSHAQSNKEIQERAVCRTHSPVPTALVEASTNEPHQVRIDQIRVQSRHIHTSMSFSLHSQDDYELLGNSLSRITIQSHMRSRTTYHFFPLQHLGPSLCWTAAGLRMREPAFVACTIPADSSELDCPLAF